MDGDLPFKSKAKNLKKRDYERKLSKVFKVTKTGARINPSDSDDELRHHVDGAGEILQGVEVDFEETINGMPTGRKNRSKNVVVINNSAVGADLPRKWRAADQEEEEVDYSDDDEDDDDDDDDRSDNDEPRVTFDIPKTASNPSEILENPNVKRAFSEKETAYMTAKEKHLARQARKEARLALEKLQKEKKDGDEDEEVPELKTPSLVPHQQESIVSKIYNHLLKTTINGNLYTAKMSKVIGNLEMFGVTDEDFHLPPNKRSAPNPVRSAFYFYQVDARQRASRSSETTKRLTKKSLEAAWKKMDSNEKEYYLRRAELDRVRFRLQTDEYRQYVARAEGEKHARHEKVGRRQDRIQKNRLDAEEDTGSEVEVDQSEAMYVRNNRRSRTRSRGGDSDSDSDDAEDENTTSKHHKKGGKGKKGRGSRQASRQGSRQSSLSRKSGTEDEQGTPSTTPHSRRTKNSDVWGSDDDDNDDEAHVNAERNRTVDVDINAPEAQRFTFTGLTKEEEEEMHLRDMMDFLKI